MLLLVDGNFSKMALVVLGCVSLGKSQQFLDELEAYKKKKEIKEGLCLVEKQKVGEELSPSCQYGSTFPLTLWNARNETYCSQALKNPLRCLSDDDS